MTQGIDVLLISPGKKNERPYYLPLGLLSIAAYLRNHGLDVKIYDINTSCETLDEAVKYYMPRCVGFSVISGPMLKHAVAMSRRVRELDGKIGIIWGGIHPTIYFKQTLKNDYVDFVILREGEVTTLELMQSINKPNCYKNIRGIGYKSDGELIINPEREFIENLDTLPMPAWDLIDVKKYFNNQFWGSNILSLNTERGCKFRCKYCQNQIVTRCNWRGMSAKRIIEHICYLKSKYKIGGIHFMDDDFNGNRSRTIEFIKTVRNEKISIKWLELSRVNHYQDLEIVKLRKEAGCRVVDFGVESGSDRMLRFIQKDQTVKQIKKAFANCKTAGINANILCMIGLPTETEEELQETIMLINELPHIFTICAIFKPYPGNELFDFVKKNNNFYLPEDLEELGDLLSYNDVSYNFSKLPTEKLIEIKRRLDLQNIIEYLKVNLRHGKFKLIFEKLIARQAQYL